MRGSFFLYWNWRFYVRNKYCITSPFRQTDRSQRKRRFCSTTRDLQTHFSRFSSHPIPFHPLLLQPPTPVRQQSTSHTNQNSLILTAHTFHITCCLSILSRETLNSAVRWFASLLRIEKFPDKFIEKFIEILTNPDGISWFLFLGGGGVSSLQLTSESGIDKEFQNIVISQFIPHTVGKIKNQ
jgi:hypothetical protein